MQLQGLKTLGNHSPRLTVSSELGLLLSPMHFFLAERGPGNGLVATETSADSVNPSRSGYYFSGADSAWEGRGRGEENPEVPQTDTGLRVTTKTFSQVRGGRTRALSLKLEYHSPSAFIPRGDIGSGVTAELYSGSRRVAGSIPSPGCVEVSLSTTPNPQLLPPSWLAPGMAFRHRCVSV